MGCAKQRTHGRRRWRAVHGAHQNSEPAAREDVRAAAQNIEHVARLLVADHGHWEATARCPWEVVAAREKLAAMEEWSCAGRGAGFLRDVHGRGIRPWRAPGRGQAQPRQAQGRGGRCCCCFWIEELGAGNSDTMEREVRRLLHGCEEDREGAIGGDVQGCRIPVHRTRKAGGGATDGHGREQRGCARADLHACCRGSFCRVVRLGASREKDEQALAATVRGRWSKGAPRHDCWERLEKNSGRHEQRGSSVCVWERKKKVVAARKK
jgi:hypothetical protein